MAVMCFSRVAVRGVDEAIREAQSNAVGWDGVLHALTCVGTFTEVGLQLDGERERHGLESVVDRMCGRLHPCVAGAREDTSRG